MGIPHAVLLVFNFAPAVGRMWLELHDDGLLTFELPIQSFDCK